MPLALASFGDRFIRKQRRIPALTRRFYGTRKAVFAGSFLGHAVGRCQAAAVRSRSLSPATEASRRSTMTIGCGRSWARSRPWMRCWRNTSPRALALGYPSVQWRSTSAQRAGGRNAIRSPKQPCVGAERLRLTRLIAARGKSLFANVPKLAP